MRSCEARYSTETPSKRMMAGAASTASAVAPEISDSIRKLVRLLGEIPPAEDQREDRGRRRCCHRLWPGEPADVKRRAENFDQVIHRIEIEQPAQMLRDDV